MVRLNLFGTEYANQVAGYRFPRPPWGRVRQRGGRGEAASNRTSGFGFPRSAPEAVCNLCIFAPFR